MNKTVLLAAAMGILFAACKSNNKDKNVNLLSPDSTKAANYYSDSVARAQALHHAGNPAKTPAGDKGSGNAGTANSGTSAGSSSTGANGTASTDAAPKKKGWSSAAKGAVIGAGTGAAAGAVIDRKHGQGAVLGAVVGAGAGYLIGRDIDKRKGRIHKKKKKSN